jgi:membrane protein implicated in regulation of membrane protease activity
MLAANVWTWWIGIALFLGSLLILVVLVAGYLKTVSAQKYPTAKQQRARHTDL